MEKSSRQKWSPTVTETVLLLRPAVKRGREKKATRRSCIERVEGFTRVNFQ